MRASSGMSEPAGQVGACSGTALLLLLPRHQQCLLLLRPLLTELVGQLLCPCPVAMVTREDFVCMSFDRSTASGWAGKQEAGRPAPRHRPAAASCRWLLPVALPACAPSSSPRPYPRPPAAQTQGAPFLNGCTLLQHPPDALLQFGALGQHKLLHRNSVG